MFFSRLAVGATLVSQTLAIPVTVNHVVHERRDFAPKTWIKRDRLHADATLPVRIGMTQSNLDKGYDLLMEVYV